MSKSLLSRMQKSVSKNANVAVLSKSDIIKQGGLYTTQYPIINLMLTGKLDGRVSGGINMLVGDTRTFKSLFCIANVAAFLKENEDAVVLFVDSEGGSRLEYFESMGCDMDRIIHLFVTDLEEMQIEVMKVLDSIETGDTFMIYIDSISQLPSRKEVQDAIAGKDTTDMTRARVQNSFWRSVTPRLKLNNIPLFVINSHYESMTNIYAESTIKGGKQGELSSDNILAVTRSQEKEGAEQVGWNFNYNMRKSRSIKEKSKMSLTVTNDKGIFKYSGIFEMALSLGFIYTEKQGWYKWSTSIEGVDGDKSFRRSQISDDDYERLLKTKEFTDGVRDLYTLHGKGQFEKDGMIMKVDEETGEVTYEEKTI